jgi:hypothetical protein
MKKLFFLIVLFSQFSNSQSQANSKNPINGLAGIYYTPIIVDAKPWEKGKDLPWTKFETCIVQKLDGFVVSKNKSKSVYGSDTSIKFEKTGYFRVEKKGNRWWIIDPFGYRNILVAVNSLRPGKSEKNNEEFKKQFGEPKKWLKSSIDSLNKIGIYGAGSWSEDELIREINKDSKNPFTYSPNLNFMSSYGKKRGGTYQLAGNTGYPNQTIFVFDPEFEQFCDERAKELIQNITDPNLFGYFSDNELPLGIENLDGYLKLENKSDAGYIAATKWLENKGVSIDKITDKLREEFAGFVADKYYAIVSKAIKKYDSNHLYLGSRLHGSAKKTESIITAAGKYCDILSINYYGDWSPNPTLIDIWDRSAKKPFIVTEFYTKAMDAGLENTSGAGFTVNTQTDKGYAYQHFCLNLLNSKSCVGWHYFKYQDNDPTAKNVDPSNTDSNKGLVNNSFRYYKEFVKLMKEFNDNKYQLIQYLETESPKVKNKEPMDIIFAIGQSNMSGRGEIPVEDSGKMSNVFLLNKEGNFEPACQPLNKYSDIEMAIKELKLQGVSPSYSCMLNLQKTLNKPFGLVMNAQGGSSIKLWFKPGKPNYDASLARAKEAQKHGKLVAIIWNQGSTDNKDAQADNFVSYKANLKEMVEHFRQDLNEPNLPFICGELSERPDFIDFNNNVVRKIKEFIPNSDFVTAEGTKLLEDNIHYDASSAKLLGERYAQKVVELTKK